MKFISAVALGACVLIAASASPQRLPWQNSPNAANAANQQLVHFLYPQQVTEPAGKPQTVELHFRVVSGLHVNSHTPRQKGLIPTNLAVGEPSGVNVTGVDFPAGSEFAFPADPATKLSIYSGEFVLKMHLVAQPGNHLIQGVLRYQACDNSTCFPPRTVPVPIDVVAK
jgi:hypothetical protein